MPLVYLDLGAWCVYRFYEEHFCIKSKMIFSYSLRFLVIIMNITHLNLGIVTNIHQDESGNYFVDGEHTKDAADGKSTRYRDYNHQFKNIPVTDVRVAPSALDTMI